MGIVVSLMLEPLDPLNTIYAGTNASGLWRTTDGGASWHNLTEATRFPGLGIQDVVRNPYKPSEIYIATGVTTYNRGYGAGVLKSTDGGATWSVTGLSFLPQDEATIDRLVLDPWSPSTLYATVRQSVYKTTDGGVSWTKRQITTNTNARLRDIELMSDGTIFVAGDDRNLYGGGAGIWRSPDGGITWQTLTPGLLAGSERFELAVTLAASDNLYALYSVAGQDYFQVSTDRGATWQLPKAVSVGVGYWFNGLTISAIDPDVFYACGMQTFKSTDGGLSFVAVTSGMSGPNHQHDDCRRIAVIEHDGKDIVVTGNDGGVNRSLDGGLTWSDLGATGLAASQFYGIGGIPGDPGVLIGGAQDCSSHVLRDGTWTNTSGLFCDGGESLVDPRDPLVLYAQCNGRLHRSDDGGVSWGWGSLPSGYAGLDAPFVFDPTNPDTLLFGTHEVSRSQDRGSSWSPISPHVGLGISALAVAPSDPRVIYFAEGEPQWGVGIWRTDDGGASWTDVRAGLTGLTYAGVTDIEVDPVNPKRLWVSLDRFKSGMRVFHSQDGGVSWVNQSAGLPELPVNALVYQRCSDDALYAGTDGGVFRWNKGAGQWECWSTGLPVGIVTDFEINEGAGKIRAATFGRGLWEARLPPASHSAGCGCASPPPDLELWLPLDESAGASTVDDVVAGGGHGMLGNGLAAGAPGKVGNGVCLDGIDDSIDLASSAATSLGADDFSVAVWVQANSWSGVRAIVDKRLESGLDVHGYAFFVENGVPSLILADGAASSYTAGSTISADGLWHHLAVTVDRDYGGWFYLDGRRFGGPFTPGQSGSLDSSAPFRVGAPSAGSFSSASEVLDGCLDEVQLFRRSLTPFEVSSLWNAGRAGTCKIACGRPSTVEFCSGVDTVPAAPEVCNHTVTAQTLDYALQGLPIQAGCDVPGSTSFNPAAGTALTVPAGQCSPVPTSVERPVGLDADGLTACYLLRVEVPATGESVHCRNAVIDKRNSCVELGDDDFPDPALLRPPPRTDAVPIPKERVRTEPPSRFYEQ